jgi:polyribonucleotide nucleotidyltransferase
MFNIVKKEIKWGGETLSIETGKIARQADGSVIVKYGETSLLCTVCAKKEKMEGVDFFPLTCVYQEKYYAAGKIPGGFFKREGKPTEKETLISRLIDRPIRPLFDEEFKNETQVICTVLEHDGKNDSDIPALVGASAALAISGIPFNGPISAVKVGLENGKYILNPKLGENEDSKLELVVAATESSIMMVESEASEISEDEMLGALEFAHKECQPVINMINDFAKEAGKERWAVEKEDNSELYNKISSYGEKSLRAAYNIKEKQDRVEAIKAAKDEIISKLEADLADGDELDSITVDGLIKKLEKNIVRGDIIEKGTRIDGRKTDQVRQIVAETDVLKGTHGSALFTRGETQALVVATLGTGQDGQRIDGLEGDKMQHFMLHYNFPPYSVGEVGRMMGPGRREIGHGKLAYRAINALIPTSEEFPYTIRIVSEITESNGSSSMATVCGTSMALMDAGVPIARPVAGIAMGLILEGEKFAVLSDILGDEDHLGDMDFKVAGTDQGITSLQMDIKIQGITIEIMKQALEQAHGGRKHILGEMAKAITSSNDDVKGNAPKFTSIKVPTSKIREIIGAGGKVIKNICEVSGAKIDIDDSGEVKVAASTADECNKALDMINEIIAEPIVGETYEAKVMKIMDFGAIVQFMGKQQGLVHISELAEERTENVEDVVKLGDEVKVKVINIDKSGKVKLSMKQVSDSSTSNDNKKSGGEDKPKGKSNKSKEDKKSSDDKSEKSEDNKKEEKKA